jgi:hypothetical protein
VERQLQEKVHAIIRCGGLITDEPLWRKSTGRKGQTVVASMDQVLLRQRGGAKARVVKLKLRLLKERVLLSRSIMSWPSSNT